MIEKATMDVEKASQQPKSEKVFVKPLQKNEVYRMPSAADLGELNWSSLYKAAQTYREFGWQLVEVTETRNIFAPQGCYITPELWRGRRAPRLGVETGVASGIVGLMIPDLRRLSYLEQDFGPLPYPRILGRHIIVCFRAPLQRYPSRTVIYNDLHYIGEGDCMSVPTTTNKRRRLQWMIGDMDLLAGLPKLPGWLRLCLSRT